MILHVLVADRHVLRVFRYQPRGRVLEEIATYLNAGARLARRDLLSDRPGRVTNGPAGVSQVYTPSSDVAEHSMQRWLRSLVRTDMLRVYGNHSDGLVLVAQPRLLSQLRAHLIKQESPRVLAELPRNLARQPATALLKRLEPTLRSAAQAQRARAMRGPTRRDPSHPRRYESRP
jgi:protein required for attachment to host cells